MKLVHPAQRRRGRDGQVASTSAAQASPPPHRSFAIAKHRAQPLAATIALHRDRTRPQHDPPMVDVLNGRHNSPLSEKPKRTTHTTRTWEQVDQVVTRQQTKQVKHPVTKRRRLSSHHAPVLRQTRPSEVHKRIRPTPVGQHLAGPAPAIHHRLPRRKRMERQRRTFATKPRRNPAGGRAKPQHRPERL